MVGDAATGYRVYTSTDGIGWSNGVAVSGTTAYTLTGLAAGDLIFVRVTATNDGGESFSTEVLGARVGGSVPVLVVNGFDRLNSTMLIAETDPIEGANLRMLLDQMNGYGYVLHHGEAITRAFDSASNEAVQTGSVDLLDYDIVDWLLGEESAPDETLDATERALLEAYLDGDGALFLSGTEVGWHLDYLWGDVDFYNDVLRAGYVGDDAATYEVSPTVGSIFDGLAPFRFDAAGEYDADYADQIIPLNGAEAALAYQGGSGGTAAVQYADVCGKLVYFAFPFETIEADRRGEVMNRVLDYLSPCIDPLADTTIISPAGGGAYNTIPPFAGTAVAGGGEALDRVEVQIENDALQYWTGSEWSGTEMWLNTGMTETWSYGLPALDRGDYVLRARAWTTGGILESVPAQVGFIYDAISPSAAILITPTGGVTITRMSAVVFDWNAPVGDDGSPLAYWVQLDGEPLQPPGLVSESIYTYTGLLADGTHTWGVQVFDAAGNHSAWVTDTFNVSWYRTHLPLVMRNWEDQTPVICDDAVVNGGFESDDAWVLNQLAVYVTDWVHQGARAVRVGIPPGEPGVYAYSSVMQAITVPAGSSAMLSMWVYPIGEGNDPGDTHYVVLYDQEDTRYDLDYWQSNGQAWEERQYDLSEFAGQTVRLYVGTRNDGDDDTSTLYLDDVTLEVCP